MSVELHGIEYCLTGGLYKAVDVITLNGTHIPVLASGSFILKMIISFLL